MKKMTDEKNRQCPTDGMTEGEKVAFVAGWRHATENPDGNPPPAVMEDSLPSLMPCLSAPHKLV